MPELLPFRGTRYVSDAAPPVDDSAVAAPPYDVIDDDERVALEARSPVNSVRLIQPQGPDRYADAAARLDAWRAAGILATDPEPAFYGYRMYYTDVDGRDRSTVGVLGALRLPPAEGAPTTGPDAVLAHERTISKHKSDRLDLLRATRANLDPIWGLSLAGGIRAAVGDTPPVAIAIDELGHRHELIPITSPAGIAAIHDAVADAPMVLADGHHRFETAKNYRDELARAGTPVDGAASVMAFVTELEEQELSVGPIHRLLAHLGGQDLRATLQDAFEVTDAGPVDPGDPGRLDALLRSHPGPLLVDGRGVALLTARPEVVTPLLTDPTPVRDTDSAAFEAAIAPMLPDTTEITYRAGADTCAGLVSKGEADAAILLRPATVEQIRSAAFAGLRFPQKTTFFEPKPRTGLVFRVLGD
ncbi:MAG: hypothetical protein JWL73_1906 [Actinomycetia bacterium]|nr:hypothetical protein [Actinomycetes bacterium]